MDETKKNPKKIEAGKKAYQARILKFQEEIFAGTSSNPASNTSNPTSNVPSNTSDASSNASSNAATTKSTDVYMYGARIPGNCGSWTVYFLHL